MQTQDQALDPSKVHYKTYKDENQLQTMMKMIETELSEPYSIYTYRYFVNQWQDLSFLAYYNDEIIGVIIGNLNKHRTSQRMRAYVGMVVVKKEYRRLKIGKKLAEMFIEKSRKMGAEEIVLETEYCNKAALKLYENLGFARVKRLMNYYLNGNDAFRLKLWFTDKVGFLEMLKEQQQQQEQNNNVTNDN
ncbi:hypothetical protein IMG5_154460 [Ichthyophthirius multifiliis]|uniref:N-acetyltransferase domain-containing protein n=1 Tax=Ichthyophthirius multifiliis TaxID=5932 RepID=G0QZ49_ICHMU|nr:hypothetical protein IMG5_154460 [Ichthyophthirius multifiliis]EGR29500.1 hypothetical protein IMG5_154460 [Ichthyophthirius multifiliis]|eukprot:XP_004030736.1 hypothetical protein IMG5_154460 [Ichthyophthirius multifiliis]